MQLTLGGPLPIYNGGLLVTRVRYFDGERRRPGLPEGVAALVSTLAANRTVVELVNLDAQAARTVIVQAGGMGEHRFEAVTLAGGAGGGKAARRMAVRDRYVRVRLPPQTRITLDLDTRRLAESPTYRLPW